MKYSSIDVPEKYMCGECGLIGVKLWRDLVVRVTQVDLRCAMCLDVGPIDTEGYFTKKYGKTDQCSIEELGDMLPAIPTEDELTYWGYTSVPSTGVIWWRNLPNTIEDIPDDLYKMNQLTKSDILNIIADLEKAIENNKKAQIDIGISDKRKGKIEAYEYAISRIKAMANWKDIKLI